MASAALDTHPPAAGRPLGRSWRLVVAARICVDGGAARAELAKDLGALSAHRLSPAELRTLLELETTGLLIAGLATESRSRLTLTAAGLAAALDGLGIRATAKPAKITWPDVRDVRLVAFALGLQGEPAARIKLLARPDGLRAAVLQKAYSLTARSRSSPARLRAALAVVALQRAFGNSIKDAMDAGAGLSAKAGRLLAGQLAAKPRDFGTDGRLIAALAAEAVGSAQGDADSLRMAVLRRFIGEISPQGPRAVPTGAPPAAQATAVAPIMSIAPAPAVIPAVASQPRPAAAARPDLAGFAEVVQTLARTRAEGWPGNRKAYISDVWQALQVDRPSWGLTEIEFKSMLSEAHRTGHIALANADLKDRRTLPKVQQSAIVFKNTVLHFVRVAD